MKSRLFFQHPFAVDDLQHHPGAAIEAEVIGAGHREHAGQSVQHIGKNGMDDFKAHKVE